MIDRIRGLLARGAPAMRADLGTPIGFVVALAGIIGAVMINGGSLPGFLNLPALLIIGGGTLGAAMISTTLGDVMRLPALCRKAFRGHAGIDPQSLIRTVVSAARQAREEGFLALEGMASHPATDPFFAQGLELVVDRAGSPMVREVLQAEIAAMQQRHQRGIDLLEMMGGYAPTMGIIGTVLGLVHVMSQLGESGTEGLGTGVAMAFMTTLYGIFSANLLFLPLASNLRTKSAAEAFQRQLIFEAVMGIQAGLNPRLLELRLMAYYRPPRHSQPQETRVPALVNQRMRPLWIRQGSLG
ncbi:MAG: motility protein A [candidate division NC10 bacterium]|nr:motility protein A [candidate division NC10 bacterium]